MKKRRSMVLLNLLFAGAFAFGQNFYFGADQSYVNEIEDCGAVYKENDQEKDVHQIFADHGCNLVRLRIWHTPSWYDDLNSGNRYSDLSDVKKSIRRARAKGMAILLDFHLSDNWADPSKQIIPAAWLPVVDDLEILKDSLYHYIFRTLTVLKADTLLPEMVQIGNETNRGILLSPEQNKTWTLDWARNAPLFNAAIEAVRDVSPDVKVALHLAGPAEIQWWINAFITNGVTDFDIIAMSYYWAWHMPTTIEETGEVIAQLISAYPEKEVMVVETGYLWTTEAYDNANNIINVEHPDYIPASPENQKQWLIDLTQTVITNGGAAVIYWEPSWVSTPCWNQWDQGSHQEHATFFDFEHNLLLPGGIEYMEHPYTTSTSDLEKEELAITIHHFMAEKKIIIEFDDNLEFHEFTFMISDTAGQVLRQEKIASLRSEVHWEGSEPGIYMITITDGRRSVTRKIFSTPY